MKVSRQVIIAVLITVLVVLAAVDIFLIFQKKQNKLVRQEPPTLSKKSYAIKNALIKTNKASGDLILANTKNFKVVYLISGRQFIAFVNQKPYATVKKVVEKWFIDKGFIPQDLCALELSFTASKSVKPDFSAKDAVATGCSN